MDENNIYIAGVLATPPVFSHESHGQRFYHMMVGANRLSGATDTLKVQIPERVLEGLTLEVGGPVAVKGYMRSYNNRSGVGSKLVLSVLAREITTEHEGHQNRLSMTGTLCKAPTYRKTPLGREICDMLLAVARYHGRSDYLPCIAWGTAARMTAGFEVGERVELKGRLQSRLYEKLENGVLTQKTAYEISVIEIKRLVSAESEPIQTQDFRA